MSDRDTGTNTTPHPDGNRAATASSRTSPETTSSEPIAYVATALGGSNYPPRPPRNPPAPHTSGTGSH